MSRHAQIGIGLLTVGMSQAALGQELPATIEVTGIVRDFRERTHPEGHPDFELKPDHGFKLYSGNIALALGSDRKPSFTGAGFRVGSEWRDADNRPICYSLYDEALGDKSGNGAQPSTGAITSAASFDQWYRDVPGVNLSMPLPITLVLQEDGHYVFDDQLDPKYQDLGGFFPIEDQLFGNPGGKPNRNFHFTFELHMEFLHDADGDQFFKFIGDDDIWVFINDELVIDLGGVHSALDQYVDVNRLGLVDGEVYAIDFFFAERHRTQSNFRIETNLPLKTKGQPSISMAYD